MNKNAQQNNASKMNNLYCAKVADGQRLSHQGVRITNSLLSLTDNGDIHTRWMEWLVFLQLVLQPRFG